MTPFFYKERHIELHKKFDELFANYLQHTTGSIDDSIEQLMQWSFRQTKEPNHED